MRWDDLIGEYGWDHDVLYILEKNGKLHGSSNGFSIIRSKRKGPTNSGFPLTGFTRARAWFSAATWWKSEGGRGRQRDIRKRRLDGEDGKVFRIEPVRPVEALAPKRNWRILRPKRVNS